MCKIKPTKAEAEALLEYIAMEDCTAKSAMETICGDKIALYMKWIESRAKANSLSAEDVIYKIINNEEI